MSKTSSHEINKNLHLISQPISSASPANPRPQATNYVLVTDVSGSMSSDLPKMRDQLKKKLPKLINEGDTLSIIWFSGKSQFGVLLEAEAVASLADLNTVNAAIDRWLRPVGLTGFKEPIEELTQLVARVKKTNKNPFSLIFLTDGCDNQWSRPDIIKAVEKAAPLFASTTFVEYGYYADRPLLTAMAEKAGGTLIFADAFDKYQVAVEHILQTPVMGGKRIEVKIEGDPIGGFAWSMDNGVLTTYEASSGKVVVGENVDKIYYLSPKGNGQVDASIEMISASQASGHLKLTQSPAHAALSLFAVRMKPEIVFPILKATGDVQFIQSFANCFGKQAYSAFMDATRAAAFDPQLRFVVGRNSNLVPPDDAFTVLDLLKLISNDQGTQLLLDHESFQYSRISRGRVDGEDQLNTGEQYKIDEIQAKMAGEKSVSKLKAYQAEIQTILDARKTALKFKADASPRGYSVSNLTYNEDRPNVSVLVKKMGTVDLSARSGELPTGVPTSFKTHIWRNYAIVRDGLVNVDKLPVVLTDETCATLKKQGVAFTAIADMPDGYVIDVKALPIMNRNMVKAVSAIDAIKLEYALTVARAHQKVFNSYKKEMFPDAGGVRIAAIYGDDAAEWLKEQGLSDGGFAPKNQIAAPVSDHYVGKELQIKLKGLSTLKSVKEVSAKMDTGKLSGCDAMMATAIKEVQDFIAKNPKNLHEKWLTGRCDAVKATVRGLIYQTAQIRWAVIVGQTWFKELAIDQNTFTADVDGVTVVATFQLREVEIAI